MKTNPGGQLDPKEVLGRDELIQELWETLEKQSVIMMAERRIGKTSVMNKMQAEPRPGWIPIYQDLEKFQTALEFASAVHQIVQKYLSFQKQAGTKFEELFKLVQTIKIGPVEVSRNQDQSSSWQEMLINAISNLVNEQNEVRYKIVFLWDEMPYMLANIRERDNETTAMQVLDVLRSLRHEYKEFRMLITGSIGLHHVLTELKSKGYLNQPVNDMYLLEVHPLQVQDAQHLAKTLIQGEGLHTTGNTSSVIAQQADYFPFYIHHIVRSLKAKQVTITPDDVVDVVQEHLTSANDPWQLRHYKERISNYYGEKANSVELILDELTVQEKPQSVKELLNVLTSQSGAIDDPDTLRTLLTQMTQDHYLTRDKNNKYSFRFSLIKRWWKLERDLD